MAIVIKEIKVRTVVEKRIVPEMELTEDLLRQIESRLLERQSGAVDKPLVQKRKRRER